MMVGVTLLLVTKMKYNACSKVILLPTSKVGVDAVELASLDTIVNTVDRSVM